MGSCGSRYHRAAAKKVSCSSCMNFLQRSLGRAPVDAWCFDFLWRWSWKPRLGLSGHWVVGFVLNCEFDIVLISLGDLCPSWGLRSSDVMAAWCWPVEHADQRTFGFAWLILSSSSVCDEGFLCLGLSLSGWHFGRAAFPPSLLCCLLSCLWSIICLPCYSYSESMPLMEFGWSAYQLSQSTDEAPANSSGDGYSQLHAAIQTNSCPQTHLNLECMYSLIYSDADAALLALLVCSVLDSCFFYPSLWGSRWTSTEHHLEYQKLHWCGVQRSGKWSGFDLDILKLLHRQDLGPLALYCQVHLWFCPTFGCYFGPIDSSVKVQKSGISGSLAGFAIDRCGWRQRRISAQTLALPSQSRRRAIGSSCFGQGLRGLVHGQRHQSEDPSCVCHLMWVNELVDNFL